MWSYAEYRGNGFAGGSDGKIHRMRSDEVKTERFATTGGDNARSNWAMQAFNGKLYIGTGHVEPGVGGAQLFVQDGTTTANVQAKAAV